MKPGPTFTLAGSGYVSKRFAIALAAVLVAGALPPAFAHHGFGNFDLTREVRIEGAIERIEFVNPHSWLHVSVPSPDADGSTVRYRCEMRGATVLRRSGWTEEMFVAGERVVVEAAPDRLDAAVCYVNTVVFADGRRLDRYGQRTTGSNANPPRAERLPDGTPNIFGEWAQEQHVLTDPRGREGAFLPLREALALAPGEGPRHAVWLSRRKGPLASLFDIYRLAVGVPLVADAWPRAAVRLTATGEAAAAALDPRDTPNMTCGVTSIVWDWTWESKVNRISQHGQEILLEYGQHGFTRTIDLASPAHPAEIEPSRSGHSIGSWQDDVLVVDTVGFLPGLLAEKLGSATPHGTGLHVIERFHLDATSGGLVREYVAVDPEYIYGEYRGTDTVYPAEIPYAVDACKDSTPPAAAESLP